MSSDQVSADLVWEIVRNNNAYLVKRKQSGGVLFSRDPMNLMNKESRKYDGFVNDKAIGVVPAEKGGVKVISKKLKNSPKPKEHDSTVTYHGGKSARHTYKAVANQCARNGYRPDLREAAVSRVSAIRRSQKPTKPDPQRKLRGAKAKKAEKAAEDGS